MPYKKETRDRVQIMSKKGSAALVQYTDESGKVSRKYIPAHEIEAETVPYEVLEQGIIYGFPWDELSIAVSAEILSDELHKNEIWTAQDALKHPNKVIAALHAALADNINEILSIASSETKRSKTQ